MSHLHSRCTIIIIMSSKAAPQQKRKVTFRLDEDDEPIVYDSSCISFRVMGKPVPMGRPRRGRANQFYNPTKPEMNSFTATIKKVLEVANKNKPYFPKETKLSLRIMFQLGPSSRSPDIDNLTKFVMDACQGYLYEDDRMIFSLQAEKVLSPDKTTVGWTQISLTKKE